MSNPLNNGVLSAYKLNRELKNSEIFAGYEIESQIESDWDLWVYWVNLTRPKILVDHFSEGDSKQDGDSYKIVQFSTCLFLKKFK